MFCQNCGKYIDDNAQYCDKCGNYIGRDRVGSLYSEPMSQGDFKAGQKFKLNKDEKIIFWGIIFIFVIIALVVIAFGNNNSNYYFSSEDYSNENNGIGSTISSTGNTKNGSYQTAIVTDNKYYEMNLNNISDAYRLIEKDSVSQKNNCPAEIQKIENELISKYEIIAVNLCEMDVDFAKELKNVFEYIYDEFPNASGYLTNLTLYNTEVGDENVIAIFNPVFTFATSNSSSSYPWVIKTQILLSSRFFLNKSKLMSSVVDCSASGHFPPNATIYSPVAHELGHYISFLSAMKYYQLDSILLINSENVDDFYKLYSDFCYDEYSFSLINEAYENYKRDTNTTMGLDEWRGTISGYALAKNNNGNYIYDETIAESFHDVYLNGENAKDASKYIYNVLKAKLEG